MIFIHFFDEYLAAGANKNVCSKYEEPGCFNPCQPTCFNLNPVPCPTFWCGFDCLCKPGLVRAYEGNNDSPCVPIWYCPFITGTGNLYFLTRTKF